MVFTMGIVGKKIAGTVFLTKWSLLDPQQRELAIAYINGLIDMKKSLAK